MNNTDIFLIMRVMILGLMLTAFFQACAGLPPATPQASIAEIPNKGPVARTVKENESKILFCARDSVSVQTGTTQKIQIQFRIDEKGAVTHARILSMTAPDPDLHDCVLKRWRQLPFPAPKDQKPKLLDYPLVLKPE